MLAFGKKIVRFRVMILIIGFALLIPALFGYFNTRINYDILTYLPDNIETVKGQNILLDDFGKGAFSLVMVDNMSDKDVAALEDKFKAIDHVDSVIWYDDVADLSIPKDMIPDEVYDAFNSGSTTMMAVFFDTSTSADETIAAITQMREVAGSQCFISGMSAMVTDLKNLCEQEEPVYVAIAVVLCCAVMMIFMDSYIVPIIFLISIGVAIMWNLGSNIFMGEISFITKALAAVLQLAVTMDYSIFLWHSYEEQLGLRDNNREEAMAHAIANTITSVIGSSITTVAGFVALCFMTFTLGMDLGIVMAKGVILGVIGCVTVLPAMILQFDKLINKTRHRNVLPDMQKLANFVTGHYKIFVLVFIVVWIPAAIGYSNVGSYYDLGSTLPKELPYCVARDKLTSTFNTGATHMVLADTSLSAKDTGNMIDEMEKVDGVKNVLAADTFLGPTIPSTMIPDELKNTLESDKYKLMIINSEYTTGTDQVNTQIDALNKVLDKYDSTGMLIGEAPCTKDLITISNHDFQVVNIISIVLIFIIIALVLKSASLPVILVGVIEFAISINLGIPFYTGTDLPFIAPICISTIQLGATVDYAILMTTRYKQERAMGRDKRTAINNALAYAIPSVIVSATGFFAATFGVGMYSQVDIISSICILMSRGALISMVSVIFILPSLFMVFDKLICKSSKGFLPAVQAKAEPAVETK
ncbi:MAG: MMPL family transporter [Eubacteriaceae bacterium]|nr:MMPL family transporter [Eubacteriaceae bacterium]